MTHTVLLHQNWHQFWCVFSQMLQYFVTLMSWRSLFLGMVSSALLDLVSFLPTYTHAQKQICTSEDKHVTLMYTGLCMHTHCKTDSLNFQCSVNCEGHVLTKQKVTHVKYWNKITKTEVDGNKEVIIFPGSR